MARQLKRWESPRHEGRNSKGKGGSARQRQRKKQMQVLRNKLKQQDNQDFGNQLTVKGGKENLASLFLLVLLEQWVSLQVQDCSLPNSAGSFTASR